MAILNKSIMSEHNQYSLKDALSQAIKKYNLEDKINEQKLKDAWSKTVGQYCLNYTDNINLYKGQLNIKISSAAVKQELSYAKTEIINKLNEVLGEEIIKKIRIY
jgi:hypothetical protein